MGRFLLKRLSIGVLLLFVVVTLVFGAIHTVPGDPARTLLSGGESGGEVSEAALARARAELGLDLPLHEQYFSYLVGVFTGDLGNSFFRGTGVTEMIAARLTNTLSLVGLAVAISLVIGITMGTIAARRGGVIDQMITAFTSVGISIPVFVVGVLLVYIFALEFGWFPAGGYVAFGDDPGRHLQLLVLPAAAVSLEFSSVIARITRASILETAGQDFVRTAKAAGFKDRQVFGRAIFRNSLTPVTTIVGLGIGTLLGSTVLVEQVFNWPGLSSLLIEGVASRDYPVIQGVVIVTAALFILINIVVDAFYGVLDPRVRQTS
ncbi:ABC transporter permease [Nesterenkonia suensis]